MVATLLPEIKEEIIIIIIKEKITDARILLWVIIKDKNTKKYDKCKLLVNGPEILSPPSTNAPEKKSVIVNINVYKTSILRTLFRIFFLIKVLVINKADKGKILKLTIYWKLLEKKIWITVIIATKLKIKINSILVKKIKQNRDNINISWENLSMYPILTNKKERIGIINNVNM